MKIHQLSLFLENKPGSLVGAVPPAGRGGHRHPHADAGRHGAVRHSAPDRLRLGEGDGAAAGGRLRGQRHRGGGGGGARPPGRARRDPLRSSRAGEVNIEYMYAFPFGRGNQAVLIFRFDQPDAAIARLQARGINVVGSVEVYNRIGNDRRQRHRRAAGARVLDPAHVRDGAAAQGGARRRRTSSTSRWATRTWSRPRRCSRRCGRVAARTGPASTATCRTPASRRCGGPWRGASAAGHRPGLHGGPRPHDGGLGRRHQHGAEVDARSRRRGDRAAPLFSRVPFYIENHGGAHGAGGDRTTISARRRAHRARPSRRDPRDHPELAQQPHRGGVPEAVLRELEALLRRWITPSS